MDDEVLTTKEAYEYLKVSRVTFLKLCQQGKIKANKVGREWRILKSELQRFLRGETGSDD